MEAGVQRDPATQLIGLPSARTGGSRDRATDQQNLSTEHRACSSIGAGIATGVRSLQVIDADNWRKREWRRITKRAGIAARPKDLRDTFASVLLSGGVPVAYVSKQLGHASIATTLKHYAKWCDGDDYVDPVRLSPSQLPADLLSGHSDQILTRKDRPDSESTVNDVR